MYKLVIFTLVNNFQLFTDNMDKSSYIFTKSGMLSMQMTCKILYTTYRFYVMQICHKFIKIKYQIQQNLCSMNKGSQNRIHRYQAREIVRTAYSIHKLTFLIIQ